MVVVLSLSLLLSYLLSHQSYYAVAPGSRIFLLIMYVVLLSSN